MLYDAMIPPSVSYGVLRIGYVTNRVFVNVFDVTLPVTLLNQLCMYVNLTIHATAYTLNPVEYGVLCIHMYEYFPL